MIRLDDKVVLLVEDDGINAILFSSFMEEWGLVVHRAHNGAEALHLKRKGVEVDLILMDIHMPVMDGIQTIVELRKAGDRTPIVVVTAGSRDEDVAKALAMGANDYLFKPVSEFQLRHVVTKWLPIVEK